MSVNHANHGRLGERAMTRTVISEAFLIPASSKIIRAVAIISALNRHEQHNGVNHDQQIA